LDKAPAGTIVSDGALFFMRRMRTVVADEVRRSFSPSSAVMKL